MAKATFLSSDKRQNFLKSLQVQKSQPISHLANPAYPCVSNLMFCDPLVFLPTPGTGNPKSHRLAKTNAPTGAR